MKKFIVFLSSVALVGSVSYAMDEEAMDGEMMMEEAPSVAVMLGGSAKMGIKNVDNEAKPDSDGLSLIREYEVTFDSSGTTDGGLVFGASISFDEGASGTSSVTKVSKNYSDSKTVKVEVTRMYQRDVWIDANNAVQDHTVEGFFDDDGAPTATGVRKVKVTYSATPRAVSGTVTYINDNEESVEVSGFEPSDDDIMYNAEVTDGMHTDTDTDTDTNTVRNGIGSASVYVGAADGSWKLKFGTGLDAGIYKIGDIGIAGEGDSFYATNGHTVELSGSFGGADFAITSNAGADGDPSDEWSAGVKYNAGQFNIGVGMDSEKGMGLSAGTDVSGVSIGMIYTKAEMGEGNMKKEKSGLGVSAGIPAGEGATLTVKYSTNEAKGHDFMEKKLVEADFNYDLGGGAKLNAGVEQLDTDGSKKTTLEASISMSF